jgi:hypothetical protein
MNNKRTALCFVGTARSIQHTHQNLKDCLINTIENCDVFVFLAKSNHANKFSDYFNDTRQIKNITIEDEPEYDLDGMIFRPQWPNKNSSRQIYIKMINSRRRAFEILSLYEKENNVEYDKIIFSRLDVKYFDNVGSYVNDITLDSLYVPDFHNTFGGVINGFNDRFAVGDRKSMEIYFSVPNSIIPYNKAGCKISAEALLKYHLEINGVAVKKLPIRFTRVRSNGDAVDMRLASQTLELRDT